MKDEISFLDHLKELRARLIKSLIVVGLFFVPFIPFANEIYLLVSSPLQQILPANSSMIATEVASPFIAPLKISFFVSLFFSIPYSIVQIWGFIAPGMYEDEKAFAFGIFLSSLVLFYVGVFFSYFVILPLVFNFFTSSTPEGIVLMTDISRYLDFIFSIFFAFGISFEIPVLIFLLCWTGISSVESLALKRPYVLITCFIFGMIITPPDVISQILLALPAYLLFEIGLLCSRIFIQEKK